MPILPLVDLLILMGSLSLLVGFVTKSIALATIWRPAPFGLSPLDFALVAAVLLGLALVLVARTWLKLHEPNMLALQSRLRHEQAVQRAADLELAHGGQNGDAARHEPRATGAARAQRS